MSVGIHGSHIPFTERRRTELDVADRVGRGVDLDLELHHVY